MYCPTCGSNQSEGKKFCTICGTNLQIITQALTGQLSPAYSAPPIPHPYEIERQREIAKGNVPTEWYSPTQPIPVKPPAIARVSMQKEDLVSPNDTTPEHAQACRELWETHNFYNAGPYTPLNYRTAENVPPPRTNPM